MLNEQLRFAGLTAWPIFHSGCGERLQKGTVFCWGKQSWIYLLWCGLKLSIFHLTINWSQELKSRDELWKRGALWLVEPIIPSSDDPYAKTHMLRHQTSNISKIPTEPFGAKRTKQTSVTEISTFGGLWRWVKETHSIFSPSKSVFLWLGGFNLEFDIVDVGKSR